MSIKQKLEWGIFPIASRRHQPRDSGWVYAPHDYTQDESKFIVGSWIAIPFIAWIASETTQFDFGASLLLLILLDLYLIWEIKHN